MPNERLPKLKSEEKAKNQLVPPARINIVSRGMMVLAGARMLKRAEKTFEVMFAIWLGGNHDTIIITKTREIPHVRWQRIPRG